MIDVYNVKLARANIPEYAGDKNIIKRIRIGKHAYGYRIVFDVYPGVKMYTTDNDSYVTIEATKNKQGV